MPYYQETYQIKFKRMVWRTFSGQDVPAEPFIDIVMNAKVPVINKRSKEIKVTPGIIPLTEEMFSPIDGRLATTEWGRFAAATHFSFKADHVNVLGGDLFSDFTSLTPDKKGVFCEVWRKSLDSPIEPENELHPRLLIEKAPGPAVMRLMSQKEAVYLNSDLFFACREAGIVLYAGGNIADFGIEHRIGSFVLAVFEGVLVGVIASGDLAYYSAFEMISTIVDSDPKLLISVAMNIDPENKHALIWQKFMDAMDVKNEETK